MNHDPVLPRDCRFGPGRGIGRCLVGLMAVHAALGAAPPDPDRHGKAAEPAAARAQAVPVRAKAGPARAVPVRVAGLEVSRTPGGAEVTRNGAGEVVEVRLANGAVIRHGADGVRSLSVPGPDGKLFVAQGPRSYVQKPVEVHGQPFLRRTWLRGGAARVRMYRAATFQGGTVALYAPARVYRPAFYRWAAEPYSQPQTYPWGWEARSWVADYVTPYPTYAGPTFWLVDYLLATSLGAVQPADGSQPEGGTSVPMPPEVKQDLADDVRRQLEQRAADQEATPDQGAEAPPPAVLPGQGPQVLVVTTDMAVLRSKGRLGSLAAGDVITLTAPLNPDAAYLEVKLVASRKPADPRNRVLLVQVVDLIELQNQMQAALDRGLDRLYAGGALPVPPEGCSGVTDAAFLQGVQPDPETADAFARAVGAAELAEQEALRQAPPR